MPCSPLRSSSKVSTTNSNTLGWTRGGGVARKNLRDADTATANADLAFARLHNEVYIHSKVLLIGRLMISDTNAEGRLYPLI